MPQDFPRVPLHPQGFDANRPYDATFAAYPAAHHGSHPPGPVPAYSTQMTPLNYGSHTRSAYDGQVAYLDYSAPPPPPSTFTVHRCSPTRGRPGTQLTVSIAATWDIMANSNSASLQWNRSRKFPATISRHNSQDDRQYHYLLSSQVPHLPDISEWVSEVPIMVVIDSPTGEEYTQDVGNFTYEPEFVNREPQRLETEDIRQGFRGSNMEMRNEVSDYQPYQPTYTSYRPQYSVGAPYENLPAQSHIGQQLSAPPMQQQHSQPLMPWTSQSRINSISARQLPTITPSNPKLVRTSTLDAFRTPIGQSAGTGAYYHQAMKPPSVHLRFESDLERIGRPDLWTEDQLRLSRRVVYFRRQQNGAEILLKFSVAKPDEVGGGGSNRPPLSIPLSCILWPRKTQCFVTSVDTIALLEFIMNQKFPTEEKNRIRRNLEHFKPVTVKKPIPGGEHGSGGSEDTNELFTTIMGFSAPKPRNIEKDIKVFRWKDLKSALLKITGKYSIKPGNSLPPPQPPIPTPASSTGGSSGYSIDNNGLYVQTNDRASNMPFSPRASTTRSISGHSLHGYAPASFAGASSSGQRLNSPPYGRNSMRGNNDMHHQGSMNNQMPTYEHSNQNWPTTPTHHMPMPAPHAPSQYGTPRPSWDLGMPGALPAFPETTGGAAGVGTVDISAHQQAHSPRTVLIGDSQRGEDRGRNAQSGLLRHHVGAS